MWMVDGPEARVVIVDANAHIRRLVATLLGALQVRHVVEARDCAAAARLIKQEKPDLIITDWTGDPTEVVLFVHRLRRGELGDGAVPVLAMAGTTHHAVLEKAQEAGIDDVIAKPLSAMDIIHRAGALLDERRSRLVAAAARSLGVAPALAGAAAE